MAEDDIRDVEQEEVEDTDADTRDDTEVENSDMEKEVEDSDADTRDIEETEESDFSKLFNRMGELMDTVGALALKVDEIANAQSVMVTDVPIIEDTATAVDDTLDFAIVDDNPDDELDFNFDD